jgi:hypothetical protein
VILASLSARERADIRRCAVRTVILLGSIYLLALLARLVLE